MKSILIPLTLFTSLSLALAQEKLPREEALAYAKAVSTDPQQFNGTPITTDVDVRQPVAVRDGDYGGMVLPQKALKVETIAGATRNPAPIGHLWLHKLTPMRDGSAVEQDQLRVVTVRADGTEASVPQCALAVRRTSGGALELLVFGKGKEPLFATALKTVDAREQAEPIDLEAERDGDSGRVTLRILGRYEATIAVTELAL